jgi:glycosyltransferase involved in cell wall biosynthesis
MNVLQYTHAGRSGAAHYVAGLCHGLADEHTAVTLLCPRDFEYSADLARAGVRVFHGPPSLVEAHGRAAKLWYALAQGVVGGWMAYRHTRRGDVVHANFIGLPVLGALLLGYLRLSRRIVVLTVHDVTPHRLLLGPRWERQELALLRLQYRVPSHLVVHYAAAAAKLGREFGVPARRITVIPHGADVPVDVAAPAPPNGRTTVRLALLGSIRANKGVHLAIAAIQALRRRDLPVELTIAGYTAAAEAGYWRTCRAAIDTAPDGLHVVSGYLSDAEMRSLLLRADAVLLPYRSFSAQSGVAIDALVSGRAIIATGAGGLDDLLKSCNCGIRIGEPSEAAVAAAVEQAITLGPSVLAQMGAAGAAYAREQLAWRVVARRHMTLYQQLAPSR